ncbi:MAG: protein of unknown function with transrane region [Candidatus Taylorbacteria bacterium]|nr:protein of unknown function with transrane region [Candidatus Taylorbacteria bacterium]
MKIIKITLIGILAVALISPAVISSIRMAKPKSPDSSATSGISGTVLLGPSCPVMRDPPEAQCADKPYATSLVAMTPDETHIIAEFKSDAQGKFTVRIPPGEYAIRSAASGNMYPRCSSGTVNVKAGMFADTTVSCDTGIR